LTLRVVSSAEYCLVPQNILVIVLETACFPAQLFAAGRSVPESADAAALPSYLPFLPPPLKFVCWDFSVLDGVDVYLQGGM
jgi:hypothetical protein